jgi:hypothetical protein
MRKLFWLIVLVGAYFWILTSGHDQFVFENGKAIYSSIAKWIEGADADFQLRNAPSSKPPKKKSRRWD